MQTFNTFIGIDPGVNGAIAAIDANGNALMVETFPTIKTAKTPVRKMKVDRKTGIKKPVTIKGMRTVYDFVKLVKLVKTFSKLPKPICVTLESVHSMPRDSKVAAFTFGGAYWSIQTALAAANLNYSTVNSKVWQSSMNLIAPDRSALRELYRQYAQQLFPSVKLSRGCDADKAAALMIAEYSRRKTNVQEEEDKRDRTETDD